MTMLKDSVILQNDGLLDVDALEQYITETLGGVVGEDYKDVDVNITFTEGAPETGDQTKLEMWSFVAVGSFLLLATTVLLKKRETE